jgi:alpha,alpha-trehalase
VRVGNGAYDQEQNGIWGTILDSVYLHVKSRDDIPETLRLTLKQQVEEAIKHWRGPDRSIWEVRGEPQHFTSSKIMCWVALNRGAKLAELQGERSYAQYWHAIAEDIRADVLKNGVDARGVLVQRYGSDGLVLRYRVKETEDELAGEEGAFTICSFWLVSALAEIGEVTRARRRTRRSIRTCGTAPM